MSKTALASLVLQKMNEKKQLEKKNTPHYEVLQLLTLLQIEHYNCLSSQISQLKQQLSNESGIMEELEEHCKQLENTGKKNYPRIIINPDFIASQKISSNVKQFYRKASNTFLREDLIKRKHYEEYEEKRLKINEKYSEVKGDEDKIDNTKEEGRKLQNEKRIENLKLDLKLRGLKEEQKEIQKTVEEEAKSHERLLAEYQVKKKNIESRILYSEELAELIEEQKYLIQKYYNPIAYRNYQKKISDIRIKNQYMQKNLSQVSGSVKQMEEVTKNYETYLETKANVFIQGKSFSPYRKKRISIASEAFKFPRKTPLFNANRSRKGKQDHSIKISAKSGSKQKFQLTPETSCRRTATSSMTNLFKESIKRKHNFSQSVELGNN